MEITARQNRPMIQRAAMVLMAVIAGFSCQALATTYTVTDLGAPLGGTSSAATSINASGQIVGNYSLAGSFNQRAFLYSNGVMSDLGTLGYDQSLAYQINDAGQVVGNLSNSTSNAGFLYSNGVMTSLASYGGPNGMLVYGINNSGQISGAILSSPSTYGDPGILLNGTVTDLGSLSGGFGIAYGISNSGEAVGESSDASFLYANGALTNLNVPALVSSAYRINAGGEIIGNAIATHETLFFTNEGYVDVGGTITLLGAFGGTQSFANGINDSGQVVGSATFSGNKSSHAFIYSNGEKTDLNSLIPQNSGWVLTTAADINDDGLIVGGGINPEGQANAFLLTPVVPEPAAISLLLAGAVCLLARRVKGRPI